MLQGGYGDYADNYMDERDVIFQAKEVENLINAIARDTNEARMAAAQDDILEMQEEESKQEK